MKNAILPVATVLLLSSVGTLNALTIKKGQVLGADGKVYDGASPEHQAAIVERSKQKGWFGADGKRAGVEGSNLFIVVEDDVVFVPLEEIRGKSKEGVKEAVRQHIVSHLTENLKEFHSDGGSVNQADVDRDLANATGEATDQIADEAARLAEYDAEAAAAFVEASLDLATAVDDASRAAAEQAIEAAVQSVAVQEAVEATMSDLDISEELAEEIVASDSFFRDMDGNYISEAEARDQGLID